MAADGIVVLISSVCPLVDKDKRLVQTSCWRNWLGGKLGLALVGRAELSKTLIQLPADDCCCTPFLFGLRPPSTGVYRFYGRAIVDLQEDFCRHTSPRIAAPRAPLLVVGHCQPLPLQEMPKHSQVSLAQSPVGSLLLSPGS